MPFVLLATQRTGSSWVQEMLNSHPRVKVYSELFLAEACGTPLWEPNDIEFVNTFWEKNARRPQRVTRPYWTARYLQRVWDQPRYDAVGFKYMYDQVRRSPTVLPYAAARRARVVHLIRRNLLDAVISSKRAASTGLYHVPRDGRAPIPWLRSEIDDRRVHLDPPEVIAELERLSRARERARAWLRWSRTPTIEVEYEALAHDSAQFGRILEFLALPSADSVLLHSGLTKIRSGPRAEVVENMREVETALAGTSFESYVSGV